jgi:hypothetical protein
MQEPIMARNDGLIMLGIHIQKQVGEVVLIMLFSLMFVLRVLPMPNLLQIIL